MPTSPRSRVTLRPESITFDDSVPLSTERTYARDYSTQHLLGEGGMGKVFAARDENLGRRVAIKELRPEVRARPDLMGRFIREAQIGGQLEHPNIVPIYAFQFSPDGGPAFVMQLIDGESLADYLDRARELLLAGEPGVPSLKERVAIILPICNAIAYAHGRGVLHRDLKPDNVMLGPHNVVLVTDWGIARVDGDEEGGVGKDQRESGASDVLSPLQEPLVVEDLASARTMLGEGSQPRAAAGTPDAGRTTGSSPGSVKTALGAVMGTPQYMSPEQAIGATAGHASDQYSLGLMCLELATLRLPRSHENSSTAYSQAVLGEQCSHVDLTGKPLDRRLSAIIARATAKDADARYENVEAFVRDLRAFLLDQEVSVFPDSAARKFLRHLQQHPVRSVSLGAVILLLLAAWALVSTMSAATRASAARDDAKALSGLTSAVLAEGRTIEQDLLNMDSDLVGLAQIVRLRLDDVPSTSGALAELIRPSDLTAERAGVFRNPIDGTLRSYREPVVVIAPSAGADAKIQASRLSASRKDLIDLYLASIDESAHRLPLDEQEALMVNKQGGIVRLMIALESGVFAQFPGRADLKEDYDARRQEWYAHAIATQGSSFSRPKYGPLGRIPRIALTRPIASGGRLIGVVAAGFWLRPLTERLGLRAADHLQSAFLAAPDGKEIASRALLASATHGEPEAPVALLEVKSSKLRKALTEKHETGYLVDGEKLFVYTKLAVEDWYLVHEYSRTNYLKLVR